MRGVNQSLAARLLIRGSVLLALCLLASACTAGASQWEGAHGHVPIKTVHNEYIGW